MVWTNLHRTCAEILTNESEWRPDSDQWEVSGGVSLTTAECGDERVSAQCSSACQHTCSDQRISQVVGDYQLENEDDHRRVILNHQEEWQSMSEQDIDEINYKMSSFSSSFSTQAIMVNLITFMISSWKYFFSGSSWCEELHWQNLQSLQSWDQLSCLSVSIICIISQVWVCSQQFTLISSLQTILTNNRSEIPCDSCSHWHFWFQEISRAQELQELVSTPGQDVTPVWAPSATLTTTSPQPRLWSRPAPGHLEWPVTSILYLLHTPSRLRMITLMRRRTPLRMMMTRRTYWRKDARIMGANHLSVMWPWSVSEE